MKGCNSDSGFNLFFFFVQFSFNIKKINLYTEMKFYNNFRQSNMAEEKTNDWIILLKNVNNQRITHAGKHKEV